MTKHLGYDVFPNDVSRPDLPEPPRDERNPNGLTLADILKDDTIEDEDDN